MIIMENNGATNMTTTKHPLQSMLEYCKEEGLEIEVRSYSGRGMYGGECLAVTGNLKTIMCAVVQGLIYQDIGDSDKERIGHAMERTNTDSMAFDTVLYWPGVQFTDEEGGEEGEQDEPEMFGDEHGEPL